LMKRDFPRTSTASDSFLRLWSDILMPEWYLQTIPTR
jgi:hypothetical protein